MQNTKIDTVLFRSGQWLERFPFSTRGLIIACVIVATLYLVAVTNQWWPTPDSALYQSLGRSLAEGRGYTFNGETNVAASPGLPMILAGISCLFGSSFLVFNLFITLCGLGAIILTYLTLVRMGNRRTAILATLLCALSYRFFLNSHKILTDIPFVLVFWAILYCVVRFQTGGWFWLILSVLLCGFAAALRIPGVPLIGCLSAGLIIDRSKLTVKRTRVIAGIAIFAAAAAGIIALYLLAKSVSTTTPGYLIASSQSNKISLLHYPKQLVIGIYNLMMTLSDIFSGQKFAWPVGAPLLVLVSAGIVHAWKQGRRLAASVIVLYPLSMIVVTGAWAIRARYFLPVQALYIYASIEGLDYLCRTLAKWRHKTLKPATALKITSFFIVLAIAANAPKILRIVGYYTPLAYTQHYYEKMRHGSYRELHPLAQAIMDNSKPQDRVLLPGDKLSILHFLSRRLMTPFPTDKPTVPGTKKEITPADATQIVDFFEKNPQLKLIVIQRKKNPQAFLKTLDNRLGKMVEKKKLKAIFTGRDYQVFKRNYRQ